MRRICAVADVEAVEVPHGQHPAPERRRERLASRDDPHWLDSPPVSTLSRYVASRFLRAFVGALVILALAVLVVDMLLNLEDVLEAGAVAPRRAPLPVAAPRLRVPALPDPRRHLHGRVLLGRPPRAQPRDHRDEGGRRLPARRADPGLHLPRPFIAIGALLANETLTVARLRRAREGTGRRDGPASSSAAGTIWYHTGRYVYNIRSPDAGRRVGARHPRVRARRRTAVSCA